MPCAASPAIGGWSFAVDPDLDAAAAPALWRPQDCALVAIAEPAPDGFAATPLADLLAAGEVQSESLTYRDWHLVLAIHGRRHRLWVRECVADEALALANPADVHRTVRLEVAAELVSQIGSRRACRPAGAIQPGASERWRLVQWLRLLDALAEAPPARELAALLLRGDASAFSAAEWNGSGERRRIARWRRAAIAMRDGGYRRLLAGR